MSIFKELRFNVNDNVFLEVFTHPDSGFGYTAAIPVSDLSKLQIETF